MAGLHRGVTLAAGIPGQWSRLPELPTRTFTANSASGLVNDFRGTKGRGQRGNRAIAAVKSGGRAAATCHQTGAQGFSPGAKRAKTPPTAQPRSRGGYRLQRWVYQIWARM